MKLVVIADTHMPKKAKSIPAAILPDLEDADVIIHAGDWNTTELYHELSKYGVVHGVYGNVDEEDIKGTFNDKVLIQLLGYKIGIVHGHGEKKTTEKRALEAFSENEVDMIIFGHSHIPLIRWSHKVLLFNPGSLTDKRKLPYYSYGIITLGESIQCEHVYFRDKS